jgi:type VI secretion system protein ImpA
MGTAPLFDIESFLQPISDEAPAGEDVRTDSSPASVYYPVKDARSAARAQERAQLEEAAAPPEWITVMEGGGSILQTRAKDLEIAAWLTEAFVRTDGFGGLRDCFQLVQGLVDRFWDGLHPQPDEDGIVTRVAPLTGLNGEGQDGTLIQPIRQIPLTHGGERSYALWHWDQANEVEKITDAARKQARIDSGSVTLAQFTAAVAQTPDHFYFHLLEDIQAAKAAFAAMTASLDANAGHDSPPASNIRGAIEAAETAVKFFAAEKLEAYAARTAVAEEDVPEGESEAGEATGGGRKRSGEYADREEAFRELTRIAAFFRKNEPHSPIAYTLDDLVRRGRMTLNELLAELVEDPEARKRFLIASGIKPPAEEASGY